MPLDGQLYFGTPSIEIAAVGGVMAMIWYGWSGGWPERKPGFRSPQPGISQCAQCGCGFPIGARCCPMCRTPSLNEPPG